ncbi:hypothetical protein AYI68_g1927 [Smittium mucronatum]|uniref:Uncharacterized protein n=1 Tax=Smittium mucronatum TaxID=133383 RepID=A0A1R0H498_9FUNG|nr:hypothetical protein AYI68_g1927 [Smittium mucronatum]
MSSEAPSKKDPSAKKLAIAREHLKALAIENEKISLQLDDYASKEKAWNLQKAQFEKEISSLSDSNSKLISETESLKSSISAKEDEIKLLQNKVSDSPSSKVLLEDSVSISDSNFKIPPKKSTSDTEKSPETSLPKSPTKRPPLRKSASLKAHSRFDKSPRPISPEKVHVCCNKISENKLDLNWDDFVLKLGKILSLKANTFKTSKGFVSAEKILELVQDNEKIRALTATKKSNSENDSIVALKKIIGDLETKVDRISISKKEFEEINKKLDYVNEEKRQLEIEYENLLEKVDKMQNVVKAKMKAESEEIDRLREQISIGNEKIKDLQAQIEGYASLNKDLQEQIIRFKSDLSQSQENSVMIQYQLELEQRNSQNALQEFENSQLEYEKELSSYRRELEILSESKSILENKNFQLQMDVSNLLNVQESWTEEKAIQNTTINNLQSALDSLQHSNESEINDLMESIESERNTFKKNITELKDKLDAMEKKAKNPSLEMDIESYNDLKLQYSEQATIIAQLRHQG